MKSVFLVFMVSIFSLGCFIPKGDFWALNQMPQLLEHFHEHQKENDISFLNFLILHYANPEHHHADNPNAHHQLPALDNHCCHQLWDLPSNSLVSLQTIYSTFSLINPIQNQVLPNFFIQYYETELLRPPAV